MKKFVLTPLALCLAALTAQADDSEIGAREYARQKNWTYQIRISRNKEATKTGDRTVLCKEGLLADDLKEQPTNHRVGWLTVDQDFPVLGMLGSSIGVMLPSKSGKGGPTLSLNHMFFPALINKKVGFGIAASNTAAPDVKSQTLAAGVFEDGTAYGNLPWEEKKKEYSIVVVINPGLTCQYFRELDAR